MSKKRNNSGQRTFEALRSARAMPEGYYSGDKPNPNLRRFVEQNAIVAISLTRSVHCPRHSTGRSRLIQVDGHLQYACVLVEEAARRDPQYILHFTEPGDIVSIRSAAPVDHGAGRPARRPQGNRHRPQSGGDVDHQDIARLAIPTRSSKLFDRVRGDGLARVDGATRPAVTAADGKGTPDTSVYSQVFQCPRCLEKIALYALRRRRGGDR